MEEFTGDTDSNEKAYYPATSIEFNNEIMDSILEMVKWSKFLSIIGFIGVGFMILVAVALPIFSSFLPSAGRAPMGGGILSILYIALAALYFFPVYYLFKASGNLKNGIKSGDQELVNSGFKNLKSHYKFVGILTIVGIVGYLLLIVGFVFAFGTRF